MFSGFGGQMEVFACTFEIEVDKKIQRQTMEAPRIMIEQQFVSLVEQAANSTKPVKVKMSRKVPVWNQFENRWNDIEHCAIFANYAYGEL